MFVARLLYGPRGCDLLADWLNDHSDTREVSEPLPVWDDGSLSANIRLGDFDLSNAAGMRAVMDKVAALAAAGKRILLLDDLGDWQGAERHSPKGHLMLRAIRALSDLAFPGLLLAGESSLHFEEPDWYLGNGNNELHLACVTPLMDALADAALAGSATGLNRACRQITVPGERVSLYHRLPEAATTPEPMVKVTLLAGLALAGLPRLDVRDAQIAIVSAALAARERHNALAVFGAPQLVLDVDESIFALLRLPADFSAGVLCLHNFSGQEVVIDGGMISDNIGAGVVENILTGERFAEDNTYMLPAHAAAWLQSIR